MPKSCASDRPDTGADASAPTGPCATCAKAAGASKPPGKPVDPWLADVLKIMCPKDKAALDDMRARGVTVTVYDRIYFDDPYYDGTQWTTKRFEAGGTTAGTDINIVKQNPTADAGTLFHEGVHTGQPDKMSWRDKEYEAYTKGEQWSIDHGLPPSRDGFRTTDSAGNAVPDVTAIRAFVDKEYPGVTDTSKKGDGPEQIIGRNSKGDTIVQRANGTKYTRPPKAGDSYAGPETTVPPGGRTIPSSQLRCP